MGFYTDTQDASTPTNRLKYFEGTVTYNTKLYRMQNGSGEINGRWKGGQQSPNRNYRMGLWAYRFSLKNPAVSIGEYDLFPNKEGLSTSFLAVTGSDYQPEIVKNLDLIVLLNGIQDNGSGTITGSASSIISQPQHIAKLLSLEWNGSSWTGGNFDSSTYSATHFSHSNTGANYYRLVGGVTSGTAQRNRLLAAIGQELQVFFARVNGTNDFAMYSLGVSANPVAQITDKDIIDLSVGITDKSGVVNIAKASFYKDLTRPDFIETVSQGGENNYANFLELRYDDGGLGQAISAKSKQLYGENELGKKTYDWISDTISMRNTLKAIMGINQAPPVFVEMDIPLIKFSALKLYDIVTITTPQLPMFEGANTRGYRPIYNTNEQILADTDNETFHGYSYRASIISIKYDLMQRALPIINLRLRLLLNEGDPT
jgi:hypothetical protein